MERRTGFTLIELMVSMALLLVFIGMAFSTLSNYLAARSANEQQMIIEQNFRSALERMRYDFAQAGSSNPIQSPASNTVSSTLAFLSADSINSTITYDLVTTGNGTCYVQRTVSGQPAQPVTDEMHQLVSMYFVRSGPKITVIIVGHVKYFGSDRPVSFASMIVSRNANYAH